MRREVPSQRPTVVVLATIAALLAALDPGERMLRMLMVEYAPLLPALFGLLGTLLGAGIAAGFNLLTAQQNRRAALELDTQKARRERHTTRLAPFLEVVDRRVYEIGGVVGTLRAGDANAFRAAINDALGATVYERAGIMVFARRQPALADALLRYLDAEGRARKALGPIARTFKRSDDGRSVIVDPTLIDALAEAQARLSHATAVLYDAADDYLDEPPASLQRQSAT